VKAYVKRQKNDTANAEAICEAVTRANMWFVPTKTVEHQSCLTLHRARHLFIRQQTVVINSIRAYLAEFGIERMSKTGSLRTGAGIRLTARNGPDAAGSRRQGKQPNGRAATRPHGRNQVNLGRHQLICARKSTRAAYACAAHSTLQAKIFRPDRESP
jgi:hypothetical protein